MRNEAWIFVPPGDPLDTDHGMVRTEGGLYAFESPYRALPFANGNTLVLLEVSGVSVLGNGELAVDRRVQLQATDMSLQLENFARWCARQVAHNWRAIPAAASRYLETGSRVHRALARDALKKAPYYVASSSEAVAKEAVYALFTKKGAYDWARGALWYAAPEGAAERFQKELSLS